MRKKEAIAGKEEGEEFSEGALGGGEGRLVSERDVRRRRLLAGEGVC